jgi:hypothetical protein
VTFFLLGVTVRIACFVDEARLKPRVKIIHFGCEDNIDLSHIPHFTHSSDGKKTRLSNSTLHPFI